MTFMTKKWLCLICAVVMLVTVLAACSNETDTPTEPVTTETEAPETAVDTEPETDIDTEEPGTETEAPTDEPETEQPNTGTGEVTAAGRTSRTKRTEATAPKTVATTKVTKAANATLAKDKIVDMDGFSMKFGTAWRTQNIQPGISTLDDILWHYRMEEVMEEYNCKIKVVSFYGNLDSVKAYLTANKNPADVAHMLYGTMFLPALGANYLMAWDDIKDSPINSADARWTPNQLCVSAFNGKIYGMRYSMLPGVPSMRQCVFANVDLLKRNGINIDELYNAVDTKKWNWDLLRKYATACTKDTDSDGKNNTWGIIGEYEFLFYSIVWANGGRMIGIENGTPVATVASAANIEAVTFLDQIINTDKIVYYPEAFYSQDTWGNAKLDSVQEFLTGNYAFLFHEGYLSDQQLCPKAKFNYIFLPLPIGKSGKDYIMPADRDACDVMFTTEKNATKVATIYNAWARPYEDVLDRSDEQASNMWQKGDTRSMKLYQTIANKGILDYGTAVPELSSQFNHAIVSSVLWGLQSPTAALQGLDGSFSAEIGAIFANAAK